MTRWRQWLTGGVLLLFVAAVVLRRAELSRALDEMAGLSAGWVLALLGLVAVSMVAEGFYASSITPGLTVGRGAMVQQAATAANNTIIGSGPVSTGLRIAMLRSWRVPDVSVGVTVVALNVIAAYKLWAITLVVAVVGTFGAADEVVDRRVFAVASVVAVVVIGASTVLWWGILWHPRAAVWLGERLQRPWATLRRRVPRLPDTHLPSLAERAGAEARQLVAQRGIRILLGSVADQMMVVAKQLAVVRAFGIDDSVVSTAQLLIAFGLVRLAVALTPIPGGIGITEIGLAALLSQFGGAEASVLAAVLTYRALTFLLPIITGGACFAIWRWRTPHVGAGTTASEPQLAYSLAGSGSGSAIGSSGASAGQTGRD